MPNTGKERIESPNLVLKVTKDSGFPLYLQVAHQILHYVESGVLKNGTLLTSIRKQAELLQVAPLTIDEAYRWLSLRGIVAAERGVGFRITVEPDTSTGEQLRRSAMATFVEQSLMHCRQEGLDPLMFAQAVMARSGVPERKTARRELVFVECQPEYVNEYTEVLKAELSDQPITIHGLLVSSLPAKMLADSREGKLILGADFIVTTLYHLGHLRKLLNPVKKTPVALSHSLNKEALKRIAALPPGCRVGVVLGPVDPATTMVHTIEQYHGLAVGTVPYASMNDVAAVRKVMKDSDVIAHTTSCIPLLRELKVARSRLIPMRFVPDEDAVRKVRALLDAD
jgi:DNA-binding transcriptional regulator YhcF (GntR family)